MGSWKTGSTSVKTGLDSELTAYGDCPPFPGLDAVHDSASLLTGKESVLTAGSSDCDEGCVCPESGDIFFENLDTSTSIISALLAPPTQYYEIPVGEFCCSTVTYRLTVSADLKSYPTGPFHPPNNTAHVYLADAGGGISDFSNTNQFRMQMRNNVPDDSAFHSRDFVDETAFPVQAYMDFNGPFPAQSVYLWCPVLFPEFQEGAFDIKNVHIKIEVL